MILYYKATVFLDFDRVSCYIIMSIMDGILRSPAQMISHAPDGFKQAENGYTTAMETERHLGVTLTFPGICTIITRNMYAYFQELSVVPGSRRSYELRK